MEQQLDDIEGVIRGYIPQIVHMSLATCANNKPWVCEVHFAYDSELNLYFASTMARRHSQEIAANPNVAGDIITQHFLGQQVRGVYFEGTAELLTGITEDHIAYKTYTDRFGPRPDLLEGEHHEDGNKFYRITVSDFYLFDTYKSKPSQKYHLPWKV